MEIINEPRTEFPGYGPDSRETVTLDQINARIKWVELLRSGKYRQTHEVLATAKGTMRCCLGVACDPAVTPGMEVGVKTALFNERRRTVMTFGGEAAVLPVAAMEALGVVVSNPDVRRNEEDPDAEALSLAGLNDTERWTFEEIAEAVERDYIFPYYDNDLLPDPRVEVNDGGE